MNIGLVIEGVVAILLVVTAGYCFVLDRKLQALRSGQDGLRDVIAGLNTATSTAQNSILQLKVTGEKAGEDLKKAIAEARRLSDELSVMVDAGDRIADRLEGASGEKRHTDDAGEAFLAEVQAAAGRIAETAETAETSDEDWHEEAQNRIRSALGDIR